MVYIDDKSQEIVIPKHVSAIGQFELVLENCLTHQTFTYSELENVSSSTLYYQFNLSFSLPIGEYNYNLRCDNNDIEIGLLTFGDYNRTEVAEYNTNKQYKAYEG